jgi:hypothetical protein
MHETLLIASSPCWAPKPRPHHTITPTRADLLIIRESTDMPTVSGGDPTPVRARNPINRRESLIPRSPDNPPPLPANPPSPLSQPTARHHPDRLPLNIEAQRAALATPQRPWLGRGRLPTRQAGPSIDPLPPAHDQPRPTRQDPNLCPAAINVPATTQSSMNCRAHGPRPAAQWSTPCTDDNHLPPTAVRYGLDRAYAAVNRAASQPTH